MPLLCEPASRPYPEGSNALRINVVTGGRLLLINGQSASAGTDVFPVLQAIARPRNAVQWTLYYPPLVADTRYAERTADGSPLSQAVALHAEVHTRDALMVLEQTAEVDTDMLT